MKGTKYLSHHTVKDFKNIRCCIMVFKALKWDSCFEFMKTNTYIINDFPLLFVLSLLRFV